MQRGHDAEAALGVEGLRTKGPGDPSWVQFAKKLRASNSPGTLFSSCVSLSRLPTLSGP